MSVIYRVGDVEIDTSRGCLRQAGDELRLRAKTYRVLVYLLQNRDRLVTKDQLIANIWDGAAVTDDVLFRCIIDIRKALGDDAKAQRLVRTVPKLGYRFVGDVEEMTPPGEALNGGSPPQREPSAAKRAWPWISVAIAALLVISASVWLLKGRRPAPRTAEIGWWKFDEGAGAAAADSAGRSHARFQNAVAWTDGRLGKALSFPGTGGFIEGVDDIGAFPQGDEPRTVSGWIRTLDTNGDRTNLFQYGRKDSSALILERSGRPSFGDGSAFWVVTAKRRVDDGGWHLVAGVYEGGHTGVARIYVDGEEDASAKMPRPAGTSADGHWRIGRYLGGGAPYRGDIDDVRLFNRALGHREIRALYRCASGQVDLPIPGLGAHYFLAVHHDDVQIGPAGLLRNTGKDYGGVQFARSTGSCSAQSLRGADVGQQMTLSVELFVPAGPDDLTSEAGPYFRSRAAAPGDGVLGGTSAGYWVHLASTGAVRVVRLNPLETVAYTTPATDFDSRVFHKLEVSILPADRLSAKLDGEALAFRQAANDVAVVAIPSVWDGSPRSGTNHGAAGILFGSAENRGRAGGQQARNIMIVRNHTE